MKKRILFAFVFAAMLIAALSVTASAKWWDDNPFTDVKSDAWYYDAVRICNENELFNGTTKTTFTPGMKMSRAMLAQVLANADGYDKSEYTGSSFKDVKPTVWYASAVEWASRNGVTSGTGAGKFSPDALISREQLATMLRRYAEYKGMDVTVADASFDAFADADKVSDWATEGLLWAVENGVVKGADVKGTLYLNPKNNAARNECAQMLSNFLYIKPVYEINGNDLSLYTIVYPTGGWDSVEKAAYKLSDRVEASIGISLPVVSDEAPVGEYEIILGKTNRESSGIVTVDRASFENDQQFICTVQGNYLVIVGIDGDEYSGRQYRDLDGTETAVHYLLEEKFGVEFYTEDENDEGYEDLVRYNPDPVIAFPEDYYYSDEPFFDYRVFYMSGSILGQGHVKEQESQNISNYLTGKFGSYDDNYSPTPCLTKAENKATIISNILYCVSQDDEASKLTLGINDSAEYCKCSECMALYRKHSARSAPLAVLANEVAHELDALYPGFEVMLGAYTYTSAPPKDLELEKNISVEFITINACAAHAYNDPYCSLNAPMYKEMQGWYELTGGKLHFWDHSGAFMRFMTPFPDWDATLTNIQLMADMSFDESGILINSVFGGKHPDFGDIRAYMFDLMYRDPYMSEEEYDYHINKALEAYYGTGWKNLKKYIETITKLADNSICHKFHAATSSWYVYEEVAAAADEIDALWAAAAEGANEVQLARLTLAKQSWIYLRQSATQKSCYDNGTEEQRSAYVAANEALYNYVMENEVIWTEAVHGSLVDVDFTRGPDTWQVG